MDFPNSLAGRAYCCLAQYSICLQVSDKLVWGSKLHFLVASVSVMWLAMSCPVNSASSVQGGVLFVRVRGVDYRCPRRYCLGMSWREDPGNQSKDGSSALSCPVLGMTGGLYIHRSGQKVGFLPEVRPH